MKNMIIKIKSFIKAIFGPKVKFQKYVDRINKCTDCIWNVEIGTRNYCKECGCPKTKFWFWSELKTKATYEYSICPRKKWEVK